MKVFSVTVIGRVQRVGYRAWAEKTANNIGVYGWVKNLSNGNVELLIIGDSEKIDEMIIKCQRGPFLARVDNMVIDELKTHNWNEKTFKVV